MPVRSAGCFQCRKRKIRCDEKRPGCDRCKTHGVSCPGYRLPAPGLRTLLLQPHPRRLSPTVQRTLRPFPDPRRPRPAPGSHRHRRRPRAPPARPVHGPPPGLRPAAARTTRHRPLPALPLPARRLAGQTLRRLLPRPGRTAERTHRAWCGLR
ncbi:MAG: Zn(II)2Cys6 transcription factor [Proteobacteria bacterium]|nr:MAG: Zn(II)2Cys6 transcription factor [Pseudomonadota bacterium]